MSKKKKETGKTNAMRALEEKQIPYTPWDLHLEEALDGVSVAALLQQNPEQVFKTLVTRGDHGDHYVFMVPVKERLSLKKAARAAGIKHVEMLPLKELFGLTGYVHGGCSPLAMKKQFPTFVDETALCVDRIFFSGGKIGVQIEMDPKDLEKLSIAQADLCE